MRVGVKSLDVGKYRHSLYSAAGARPPRLLLAPRESPPRQTVLRPFSCTMIGLPAVALGNERSLRFACVLLFRSRHFAPQLGWLGV